MQPFSRPCSPRSWEGRTAAEEGWQRFISKSSEWSRVSGSGGLCAKRQGAPGLRVGFATVMTAE